MQHFFIIGAQRCKTTFLAQILDEHCEIELASPISPEPKFFLKPESVSRGLEYYQKTYFSSPNVIARGEKGTSYIESSFAARQIFQHFPDAKIIATVRDPIDRAISNYKFSRMNGFEKLSIEEAFKQEEERISKYDPRAVSASPFAYLRRGCYMKALENYLGVFSRDQLKVLKFEDLSDPQVLKGLFSFLGVDPAFVPSSLGEIVNSSPGPNPVLSSELEAWLRNYFQEPNDILSRTFHLDLTDWRSYQ